MKNFIKEIYPYIIIIVVVILIRTFIVTPVIVSGNSMEPNLSSGQILIVRKIGYNSSIKRFDIVVVKSEDEEIIKRIIGLPGEHISYKNNELYINDKLIEEPYLYRDTADFNLEEICMCTSIPEGQYLVLGDNRLVSKDSRIIGLISEDNIVGKAEFSIWPLTKIGNIYK